MAISQNSVTSSENEKGDFSENDTIEANAIFIQKSKKVSKAISSRCCKTEV